jgi:hypothetical protein
MKVVILYHPASEFARAVEEFAHDFERRVWGQKAELVSMETRDGAAAASLYGVVQYPAILALRDNGELLKYWEGSTLPLINEVAAYSNS